RRPVSSAARLFVCSGKAVCEDDVLSGTLSAGERLENHIVPALWERRPVPGAVERDKCAALISYWKLRPIVQGEIVGRPVCGEACDRRLLLPTHSNGLAAITAIFRGQDQFLLVAIIVALGPAVIRARFEPKQLLRRQIRALIRPVKARKVLRQLITSVLRHVHTTGGVERETFTVAD